MTRIALIADIHGNLPALEAVIADLHRRHVQQVVNLGDSLSGPLWPRETAERLMAENWPTIAGNHERQLLTLAPSDMGFSDQYTHAQLDTSAWNWLQSLHQTLVIEENILLCHGTPYSDTVYLLENIAHGTAQLAEEHDIRTRLQGANAAVIACAHTHIPRCITLDGMLLINPGSVGLPAYADDQPPHTMESGSPHARYAILEKRNGQWHGEHIALSYDHESAAAQAASLGREDWAYALRFGRINKT